MKYRCTQCDVTFEVEDGKKARCPECMGVHNLEEVRIVPALPFHRRPSFIPLVILLLVGVGCGVWFYMNSRDNAAKGTGDIGSEDIRAQLLELGIPDAEAVSPCAVTPAIEAFANRTTDDDGSEGLSALFNALLEMKKGGAWLAASQDQPRPELPLTADELLAELQNKQETRAATSWELSCLLLAAAEAAGIEGVTMAEIHAFKDEKSPADPSVVYGRFAVIHGSADAPLIFDLWSGRHGDGLKAELTALSSLEAAAPYYGHRSLAALAGMDLERALKENDHAVALADSSPTLHVHRGRIFLLGGAVEDALAEFEKAHKMHNGATTRVALAQISLMTGEAGESVEADIRATIKNFPEYHQARVLLAGLYIMRGDMDNAKRELDAAEKLAPASPEVAQGMAQLYVAQNDPENAIRYAQKSVRLSKENFASLMVLAQVYMATARFDEMRDTARRMLDKAPSALLKDQVRQMFRLADEEVAQPAAPAEAPSAPGDFELKLNNQGSGGLTLGGQKPGIGGGSLKLNLDEK